MNIKYLLVLALVGCATAPEQKPIASKPNEPFRRVSAFKDDLLYNYTVGINYPNGFDRAEADARSWCQKKYQMGAVQRTQAQCGIYVNESRELQVCAVAFKCQ